MIQPQRAESHSLDETLAELLAEHLHCEVTLIPRDRIGGDGEERLVSVVNQANDSAPQAAIGLGSIASRSTLALQLPLGGVAVWEVESRYASPSASHAATVLALQTTRYERDQLLAETEALTTQVVDDFEELSLIRALASSMEIPTRGIQPSELALQSLRPLANGVGAVSIAVVFVADDGVTKSLPGWSGRAITSCDSLHNLIERHRVEAESQPVIKNDVKQVDASKASESLHEFMMVQCRSEDRLHGWLVACNRVQESKQKLPWAQLGFTAVQASLLETTTRQLAAQLHNLRLLHQKETLFTEVVRALVKAIEAHDPYTSGHSERVASVARRLSESLGLDSNDCERIYLTGLLHDVGKIAVPDGVLQKPGRLDKEERAIIETHTEAGWRILHELEALRDVLPGVLYHHEHFDGTGYPDGLAAEAIPLDGRILAVCDAFDAMTSDRPYRAGMPIEKAIQILIDGSGSIWDPQIINVFIDRIDEINQIRREHRPRKQPQRTTTEASS